MSKVSSNWSVIKLPKLADPTDYMEEPPWERGSFSYIAPGQVDYEQNEMQVNGSLARWSHPKYKDLHHKIKNVVEQVIGEKLYPTYYYDRFYFKNQDLKRHRDRPACEISVTYHVSNNLDYDWPIYFQSDANEQPTSVICLPGDGAIYRGCDIWHWREPMKGNHKSYFHQIFFHYVRADGHCLQYAFDQCKG